MHPSKTNNMREQTEPIIERDSITLEEFTNVYDLLMIRTWEVDGYSYNLANLGWTWDYDNKVSTLGMCFGRSKLITISKKLLLANLDGKVKQFENTIRHEIAHAIDHEQRGRSDHGKKWMRICVRVGAIPERCASDPDTPLGKWTVTCPNCKKVRNAYRRRSSPSACGECCKAYNNNRYTDRYKLIYKLTKS